MMRFNDAIVPGHKDLHFWWRVALLMKSWMIQSFLSWSIEEYHLSTQYHLSTLDHEVLPTYCTYQYPYPLSNLYQWSHNCIKGPIWPKILSLRLSPRWGQKVRARARARAHTHTHTSPSLPLSLFRSLPVTHSLADSLTLTFSLLLTDSHSIWQYLNFLIHLNRKP